ncbi:hypothetical protein BCR42DRAFT_473986 [Absidia repens]|uniref:Heterokaryon incompatibility domain-containing protein n=1 Tax=Absidia repens TaxID=90262 RepID=A0A1X2HYW3_9FUNG|nr:hypothetical protein BCR42DRAFT_473986 [Absidia repens]
MYVFELENIVTQEPPETPFKVVLIDIQRAAKQRELHCVETPLASSSQLTPFVALSYRWGELPEMLVDTSQDYMASVMSFHLTDLFDLCALMAQEPDLKTIPYLWLDAICVDQVNPVRRKATIYQMTAIYEQAAYIVAVPDLHREYLATSLVNSSRIISLIATYRHMIYCLIIQKEGMAATELDQQWMDSIGIPKGNLERRQWFMDTCFSKKIRCRPTATDMGDESVDAWWVRQVEEDDWKQQISQRGSDISQAMTFLTQLIVDWSSRVWVISEYQLAKKKPSGKMKYWFMLLGYSYFLGEPFFEFHFDATTRDANVGENKGTYAFQVDQSVRLFHNAMVRQLKEQSFLEMILGSKASKNEDRFYSILPLSEYRHQLISATDQKKKSIDQWHITTIVTVKVKLFEFMKALDQLTLLFLSFQQYTLILPSFATADVAWARLTEFQQYDHTNFDFSKPDQIVALSQRQLNNGSNGDKADVLSLQPKMYYRLHYNDESIQLITGVAPEDKQQQQLWHRLGLDTVHDRSWDMVCIPNDYGPAAINDPALEDMTKLLLLGNAEKNKWILYTTYSVNYWWQYNPSAWKTYDNQSTGTVFAIY